MNLLRKLTSLSYFLVLPLLLNAQNFTLNSTADAVDATPGDGLCDDGGGNCTLRAAIQESNALGGAHTITIPAGTYLLTIAGASEDACATGDLDITSDLTFTGTAAQTTFINGNTLDRVFDVHIGGRITATEISIINGYIDRDFGGGIRNNGTITLTYCEIDNCTAKLLDESTGISGGFGGGIANFSVATLSNTTLKFNDAIGSEGPRAVNGGGGGGSTPGFGGGIYNESGAVLNLTNCTLSGNKAVGGRASRGAINNGVFSAPGSVGGGPTPGTAGAAAAGAGGNGGLYSGGGGGGSSCSLGGDGGNGGYGAGAGGTGARSCGGSAGGLGVGGFGGGGGNRSCCSSSGGGGAGAGLGGGIFNNGGTVTTMNVTIAFNEALGGNGRTAVGGYAGRGLIGSGFGGGIFNRSGTVNINNTLLSNNNANQADASNTALATTNEDIYGTITSTNGYNLIFNTGTATLTGTTTGNVTGSDPQLGALAMNGGSNFTHSITCVSPAVDAALDAVGPTLDQIGTAREDVLGGANIMDIGAFEVDCTPLPVTLLSFSATAVDNRYIDLKWETTTEMNNDYFTIERSTNTQDWEFVKNVDGAGNSSQLLSYYEIDNDPYIGPSYYRLKQTDFDGNYTYSQIRAVHITDDKHPLSILTMSPNPAASHAKLVLNADADMACTIEIFDKTGRVVFVHSEEVFAGDHVVEMNLESLLTGSYTLRLSSDGQLIDRINFMVQ